MGNKILEDGWSDSIDPLIGQGMGDTAENLFARRHKHDLCVFAQSANTCVVSAER